MDFLAENWTSSGNYDFSSGVMYWPTVSDIDGIVAASGLIYFVKPSGVLTYYADDAWQKVQLSE